MNFSVPKLPQLPLQNLDLNQIFVATLVASVVLGVGAGLVLTKSGGNTSIKSAVTNAGAPKQASQDNQTFRDFAEGTLQKRPAPKNGDDYQEGTHLLIRDGAVPVALTSSVVDLSQYEGKKVRVYGETQKAIKEGWLMDVGKVEVVQ